MYPHYAIPLVDAHEIARTAIHFYGIKDHQPDTRAAKKASFLKACCDWGESLFYSSESAEHLTSPLLDPIKILLGKEMPAHEEEEN